MNSERLEMLGSLTATISIDVWRLTACASCHTLL